MDFGIAIFVTDETIPPDAVARLTEERGFGSLFFPEHTHIPWSRESPWRGGGDLPRHYWRSLDPFVALTAAGAVTTTLRLGTGILLVIQRDPIITAKESATLDLLSGGRLELGVGAGWNREEIENHGTDFSRRFRILRERVEAIKTLWTEEHASYHGEFVSFDDVASWPKPLQRPHPPIVVGGNGEKVIDRVLAYGDIWMPNAEVRLAERIAELQERASAAGRARVPVSYFGADRSPEAIERLRDAGVDRILFYLPSADHATVEAALDELAGMIDPYR